ncbi:MAG: biotin--[acetyl-CoA-carboxylase] ligase [Eubacterium sp.]|nr:biotin--[acetyl-CoA-carboxylase] ligase [Eubacterium sp.]
MLKDNVLAILLRSEETGDFVSGASVSRDLQVSRAAVNQAVKALRADGYEIESVTNRGYRLVSGPDRITVGSLQALLGEERMKRVLCFDSTDSTNKRLQEAVLNSGEAYRSENGDTGSKSPDVHVQDRCAPYGLIAVANEQTAGRGRLGRTFSSPQDMGIYLSLLIRPDEFFVPSDTVSSPASSASTRPQGLSADIYSWTMLTSWTAVAVCRAIETVCGVRPGIKWVNDLLLNGRKICGILTQMELESETGTIRDIIIGIGVNVQEREEDFPEELRDIAGSLFMATGKKTDRTLLAAEMIRQLDRMCADWYRLQAGSSQLAFSYLNDYREHSLVTGRQINVITPRETKEAVAESIGEDFSLHVRYMDGSEEDLRGGEISIRSTTGF